MCEHGLEQAFRDVRDELDTQERGRWEQHLGDCEPCRERVRHARAVRSLSAAARSDVPTVNWRQVDAAIRAATARPAHRPMWWLVPAGALAALLTVTLWPSTVRQGGLTPATTPGETTSSVVGEMTHEVLADGSTISSRPSTRIQMVANARDAVVVRLLEGELLAEVTKRPERRAFVVQVGDAEVRVLGTLFSVRITETGAAVSVQRGVVQVTDAAGLVTVLRAGAEQIVATRQEQIEAQVRDESAHGSAAGAGSHAEEQVAATLEPGAQEAASTQAAEAPSEQQDPEAVAPPRPTADEGAHPAPRATKAVEKRRDHEASHDDRASAKRAATTSGAGTAAAEAATQVALAPASPPVPSKLVVQAGDTQVEMSPADGSLLPQTPRSEVVRMAKAAHDGNCAKAMPGIRRFLQTQRRHPNFADVLYVHGYCQIALGNREAGLRTWKRYEQMDPNGPWLRSVGDWTDPAPPDPSRIR